MSSGKSLTEGDPDELIPCPIDPVHLLRRKRMPYHIMKCAQNHNMRDFAICHFNYRHIMPKAELAAHEEVCVDRDIVEREILQSQPGGGIEVGLKGYTGVPASTFQPPDCEETWDDSNVVVDIALNRGYYSKKKGQSPDKAARLPAEPSSVKEPPKPRMPAMTGASGSEVFKLATSHVSETTLPVDRPRGRGRGRGSPPKVGGMHKPPEEPSPPRPVGRGRGILRQPLPPPDGAGEVSAEEKAREEVKKKERKLKKMLKQILELEDKALKHTLNPDQVAKLARKEDVLSMLEQVQLEFEQQHL